MGKKLLNWINCYIFGYHHWTSKVQEGLPCEFSPRPADHEWTKEEIEKEFWIYARMYCKHCRKMSKLNKV